MYLIVQEWSLRTGGLCVEVVFRTGPTVYAHIQYLVKGVVVVFLLY